MTQPIDPTANVIAVVEAAVQRQDDLRNAESAHLRELMDLRSQHAENLRLAESARIDAIRAVDVLAVSRATDAATALAQTLAAQATTLAETLRTQVAATAQAGAVSLDAALIPMKKDVEELRRFMFELAGSNRGEAAQTTERRAASASRVSGVSLLVAGAAAFSAFMLGVTGIVITLLLR